MSSPYQSPASDVGVVDEAVYQPRFLTFNGRIGRIRYLAYNFLINFVLMFVVGMVAAIAIPSIVTPDRAVDLPVALFVMLLYLPPVVVMFMLAKRRLNDLNHSGWLSLLMLIPLVNALLMVYLVFWPGSAGINDYGPPATPNSVGLIIMGLLFPIAIVGMLAAIVIPVYQSAVERAQDRTEQQWADPS